MEWTSKEKSILKQLLADGRTLLECSKILGRSYSSVEHISRSLASVRPARERVDNVEESQSVELPLDGKLKPAQKQALLDLLSPKIVETLQHNIFTQKPYAFKSIGKRQEEAVLVLSDMHTGMVNEIYDPITQRKIVTYNEAIRQQEALYLRDSIFEIHEILSKSYNLKTLHIFMLGDMITNDRIFDGQAFEIDRPYGQQVWDTVRDLTNLINQMKDRFENIHIIGAVGNHGRSNPNTYEEPVENNFEWSLYKMIQQTFNNDPRVRVEVPNTRFYSTSILGHTYYMSHGDSFRGFSRNAVDKAARDVLNALIPDLPQGFDVYIMGHMHSAEKMDLNERSSLLINGSWIPRDQYGYKMFRRYSKPQQWFFGVSEGRPITWAYALDLKGHVK